MLQLLARKVERRCVQEYDLAFIESIRKTMWRPAEKPPPPEAAKRRLESLNQAYEAKERELKYCELCREMYNTSKEQVCLV
jgi:hypothetical protein